jgi:hypothetical protein
VITDFLLDHSAVVPVALLLLAVVCVLVGGLILRSRRYGHRLAAVLATLSVLPVLVLTLVPAANSRTDHVICTVQFFVPTLTSVELLANLALFFPPTFFGTLATRRPLLMLAAGAGLSGAIETLQALVPAIGRACDTNDWAMNSIGAVIGVLVASCTLALGRSRPARRAGAPSG